MILVGLNETKNAQITVAKVSGISTVIYAINCIHINNF